MYIRSFSKFHKSYINCFDYLYLNKQYFWQKPFLVNFHFHYVSTVNTETRFSLILLLRSINFQNQFLNQAHFRSKKFFFLDNFYLNYSRLNLIFDSWNWNSFNFEPSLFFKDMSSLYLNSRKYLILSINVTFNSSTVRRIA